MSLFGWLRPRTREGKYEEGNRGISVQIDDVLDVVDIACRRASALTPLMFKETVGPWCNGCPFQSRCVTLAQSIADGLDPRRLIRAGEHFCERQAGVRSCEIGGVRGGPPKPPSGES